MKATTKALLASIITAIIGIIFATIAALVPVLKNIYIGVAIVSGTICFITFLIWVIQIFWEDI